jgi:hypothetical protein
VSSHVQKLFERKIAHCPPWLPSNIHYERMMGSVAYGVSGDSSDIDLCGFAIPPRDEVFPHLRGEIVGFGRQKQRFSNYQEHHLRCPDDLGGAGRSYDVSVYNIVDFFNLAMANNPNMVDALFVPATCVLHITRIGQMVRDNRRLFLSKACWQRFKGYAYQQLHKAKNRMESPEMDAITAFEKAHGIAHTTTLEQARAARDARLGQAPEEPAGLAHLGKEEVQEYVRLYETGMAKTRRFESVKVHRMDTKFLYHVVRLLDEVEQILSTGDLDLMRNREQMKAVRRGDMTEQQVRESFERKEKDLETLYQNSKLPWEADEERIKTLLLDCLEEHYGSLERCLVRPDRAVELLRQIDDLLAANRQHFRE